jgi:uncharacterized protein (TIGR02271 family)
LKRVRVGRDELEVERIPVGRVVAERQLPWTEGEFLVVPIYEEELVVRRQLVLREELRVRRTRSVESRRVVRSLRRERVAVEGAADSHLVHGREVVDQIAGLGDTDADEPLVELARRAFG